MTTMPGMVRIRAMSSLHWWVAPSLAHGDSRVGSADLYVKVGISDGISYLLEGSSRREHGKGAGKGDLSRSGEACRHAHHIALRNAAVDMALRKRLLEHAGLCGPRQVGVQNHDVFILSTKLRQGVAVALPGSDLLYF